MTLKELFTWYVTDMRDGLLEPHSASTAEERLVELIQKQADKEALEELLISVLADWEEYGFRGGFTLARELLLAK